VLASFTNMEFFYGVWGVVGASNLHCRMKSFFKNWGSISPQVTLF
jgi:hypothetical protein